MKRIDLWIEAAFQRIVEQAAANKRDLEVPEFKKVEKDIKR